MIPISILRNIIYNGSIADHLHARQNDIFSHNKLQNGDTTKHPENTPGCNIGAKGVLKFMDLWLSKMHLEHSNHSYGSVSYCSLQLQITLTLVIIGKNSELWVKYF